MKLPGPDHPISIEPNPARVIVSIAGRTVADTRSALTLREASYAAVVAIKDHVAFYPRRVDAIDEHPRPRTRVLPARSVDRPGHLFG